MIWTMRVFVLIVQLFSLVLSDLDSYSVIDLEHCFEVDGVCEFSRRGAINIRSLKDGQADYYDSSDLTDAERHRLSASAAAGGIYRLRVPAIQIGASDVGSRSAAAGEHVYAFLKSCALLDSQLTDHIQLHVDHNANVIALSALAAAAGACENSTSTSPARQFHTTVSVSQPVPAPVPDTQTFLEMKEREERARAANPDNRSFIAKYWMYIIPGVLILVMMGQQEQPNGGGGGGGGG